MNVEFYGFAGLVVVVLVSVAQSVVRLDSQLGSVRAAGDSVGD